MLDWKNFYVVLTLVDITQTQEYKVQNKRRNQQRNYDTLVQTISLFTQPQPLSCVGGFVLDQLDSWHDDYHFGSKHQFTKEMFKLDQKIWLLQFAVEHDDVFGPGQSRLLDALHNTPVITGLDENAVLEPAVFSTQGDNNNTLILRQAHE
jgi:hypothetical protein